MIILALRMFCSHDYYYLLESFARSLRFCLLCRMQVCSAVATSRFNKGLQRLWS